MRQLRFFSTILILTAMVVACDIIEAPYIDGEIVLSADAQCLLDAAQSEPFPASATIEKKVLLEEMTGHKCGNCPEASAVAKNLVESHSGEVILVTIHAGALATFTPGASKYSTNFTTPAGNEYYTTYNSTNAVPFGMIDRTGGDNNFNSWATKIENRLQEAPEAGIRIFNCYNPDSMVLTSVVDIKYLADGSTDDHLSVFLIEDKIVDWQKDYNASGSTPDLENYTHHNVFRGAINGIWGQPVSDKSISRDDRFTLSYSYKIDPDFRLENCSVVAFIYNNQTGEVRQTEIAPLVL